MCIHAAQIQRTSALMLSLDTVNNKVVYQMEGSESKRRTESLFFFLYICKEIGTKENPLHVPTLIIDLLSETYFEPHEDEFL